MDMMFLKYCVCVCCARTRDFGEIYTERELTIIEVS